MTPSAGRSPRAARLRVVAGRPPAALDPRELHGAVTELFWVGMELQAMAHRLAGTAVEDRILGLVTEIDDVIRDLRRSAG